MKVYKFGGASVSTADGVRNLRAIVKDERELFVIVSAMGKTTNALERVFEGVQTGDRPLSMEHITALRSYHRQMIEELMRTTDRLDSVDALFAELEQIATSAQISSDDSEMWYDRIVSYGELLSTTIIAEYLNASGVPCRWIDMRRCFITNGELWRAALDNDHCRVSE